MKTTIQWLDEAKAKHGLSDYALAPRLGITKSQMSRYRTGMDFLSDDAALQLARLLGMKDPRPIIASAHAERAKTAEARAFWQRWAAAGLAAFTIGGGGLGAPSPAAAAGAVDTTAGSVHYVNSRRRRRSTGALRNMAETLIGLVLPQPPRAA